MRLTSIPLAALLVLSAGLGVIGQTPEHPDPPPPEHPKQFGERDRPARPQGRRDQDRPMDVRQVREALEVLRQIDPEKADELEQHLEQNPQRVGRALRENFPNLGRFMAMRRYDPEVFELRVKDFKLSRLSQQSAHRFHTAQNAGDDELAAAELSVLQGIVSEHFDVRQKIREHELMKLEHQIQVLRDQLQQRADDREQLIEDRLDELVSQDKDARW